MTLVMRLLVYILKVVYSNPLIVTLSVIKFYSFFIKVERNSFSDKREIFFYFSAIIREKLFSFETSLLNSVGGVGNVGAWVAWVNFSVGSVGCVGLYNFGMGQKNGVGGVGRDLDVGSVSP